jgi:hypothetical protein
MTLKAQNPTVRGQDMAKERITNSKIIVTKFNRMKTTIPITIVKEEEAGQKDQKIKKP